MLSKALGWFAAALVAVWLAALGLGLASAGCTKQTRKDTIAAGVHGAVLALNAARDAFAEWDLAHQRQILAESSDAARVRRQGQGVPRRRADQGDRAVRDRVPAALGRGHRQRQGQRAPTQARARDRREDDPDVQAFMDQALAPPAAPTTATSGGHGDRADGGV